MIMPSLSFTTLVISKDFVCFSLIYKMYTSVFSLSCISFLKLNQNCCKVLHNSSSKPNVFLLIRGYRNMMKLFCYHIDFNISLALTILHSLNTTVFFYKIIQCSLALHRMGKTHVLLQETLRSISLEVLRHYSDIN